MRNSFPWGKKAVNHIPTIMKKLLSSLLAISFFVVGTASLHAIDAAPIQAVGTASLQTGAATPITKFGEKPQQDSDGTTTVPRDVFFTEINQTFQSNFKNGHGYDAAHKNNNNTNTWSYKVEAARRIPLTHNEDWFLRIGVEADRYDFGDNRSITPNTLQSYAAEIGVEYFRGGQLGFFATTKPGVYFSHELRGNDFDSPTVIALAYPIVDGKFYVIGGIYASILSEYPVLPVGGFLWHISEKWDLQAYTPRPRLVYKATDRLQLWGGGDIIGGSFVTDRNDHPKVSGTTVDYYELRAGVGFNYKWNKVNIEFGGGYALVRKWDFYRADIYTATQPAPYITLRVSTEF